MKIIMNRDETEKCVGEEASSLSGSLIRDIKSQIRKLEKVLNPILRSENEEKSEASDPARHSSDLILELESIKRRLDSILKRIDL